MSNIEREIKTVTLDCPKHGPYAVKAFRMSSGGVGMELKPACPACMDEREARERGKREKDEAYQKAAKLRSMNIDERYWGTDFENFDAYNAELRGHLETCRKFARNPGGKLVMLGEHGNGKTHLAVSVLKELGGKIYTATEIALLLRQSYGGGLNEWEVMDDLCTVPLLVIDEVEKIKKSEWKDYWMSHIVLGSGTTGCSP